MANLDGAVAMRAAQQQAEELALEERDARVRTTLLRRIQNNREEIRTLREQAAALERENSAIHDAAKAEHWWKLAPYLSREDVESLSNVSPMDLLSEEG